jgi:hypothetical protein
MKRVNLLPRPAIAEISSLLCESRREKHSCQILIAPSTILYAI